MTYVCDRAHQQYAGAMEEAEAAEIVRSARGRSGDNPSYVLSTIEHLRSLGIRDHWLEEVGRRLVWPDRLKGTISRPCLSA